MEENKENKIMWLEREDYCPHCHSRKALMIFDKYNNIINYPMVLDQDKKDIFKVGENSKQFTYMQCNKCGSNFFIDWSNGLPRAMHPNYYKSFMNNFKTMKIN